MMAKRGRKPKLNSEQIRKLIDQGIKSRSELASRLYVCVGTIENTARRHHLNLPDCRKFSDRMGCSRRDFSKRDFLIRSGLLYNKIAGDEQ